MNEKSKNPPRRFNSEIYVDSEDRWIFNGNRIIQKEVLNYFRKNLREDEFGIFIDNRFGELSENGYLELEGYPIHLTSCKKSGGTLVFLSETEVIFSLGELSFALDVNGCLFARTANNRKLKFRPDRNCLSDLSVFLEETKDGIEIHFQGVRIAIPDSGESPKVPIPIEFSSSLS
ncbi:hypothetical protein JWG45_04980 [Leptospira sp. 201903070]|uniref:DUF1285 domain-containing protein n=1 Tax=Leptospira ainlahdjerensis TaxID=2810033 RepID=A0ABS2U8P6_9LEPT|nr:hypothetical protein [Leptospira ainlahdjerensis]MBM9576504.1 hypothetical protein [Leptospira ainlahdjerensis]